MMIADHRPVLGAPAAWRGAAAVDHKFFLPPAMVLGHSPVFFTSPVLDYSLFPARRGHPARPRGDGANLKTQKPLSEIPEIRLSPKTRHFREVGGDCRKLSEITGNSAWPPVGAANRPGDTPEIGEIDVRPRNGLPVQRGRQGRVQRSPTNYFLRHRSPIIPCPPGPSCATRYRSGSVLPLNSCDAR